jgi:hypothetical protein
LDGVAKTWILDTETKGTGAHVVPFEKALEEAVERQDLATVTLERPPRVRATPEPAGPLKFKLLDIRSSTVLAEGVNIRAAVELLQTIGSVVDVRIYVWMPKAGRWRLLTLAEQKALWEFRGQLPVS